jgi:hypothetical protein
MKRQIPPPLLLGTPTSILTNTVRDPADEMVLEAAINGAADVIVTYSVADFGPAHRFGLNGWRNEASDTETLAAMLDLAAGDLDENGFAAWLRESCVEG